LEVKAALSRSLKEHRLGERGQAGGNG